MKKQAVRILILITAIFAAFTAGFFTGRNLNHGPVQISVVEAPEMTVPSETEACIYYTLEQIVPLDLNTATREELLELPGIGEVMADRILDYRRDHGPFSAVEELLNVSGIGPKKLEALLEYVIAGG